MNSKFLGVVPSDRIPGTHWTCVLFEKDKRGWIGTYFDSYGFPPCVYSIRKYLNENCYKWSYNTQRIQEYGSSVCGVYVILFLTLICRGNKKENVLQYLKSIGDENVLNVMGSFYNKDNII